MEDSNKINNKYYYSQQNSIKVNKGKRKRAQTYITPNQDYNRVFEDTPDNYVCANILTPHDSQMDNLCIKTRQRRRRKSTIKSEFSMDWGESVDELKNSKYPKYEEVELWSNEPRKTVKMNYVFKKVMSELKREYKKKATISHRQTRDYITRARRLWKDGMNFWKKSERKSRKNTENYKINSELFQARKQKKKLSLLMTQTELYSSFLAGTLNEQRQNEILEKINNSEENHEETRKSVIEAALRLAHMQREQVRKFEEETCHGRERLRDDLADQPDMFVGQLKSYQLVGMRWLINLYDQGINGILADEMGLGKTIQTIAFLSFLAESKGIWGPFLVIAPSSTLYNWQKEITHFNPHFKIIPYWGCASDRKVLRQLWKSTNIHKQQSSFHVLITSYKIVVKDFKAFQRIKWWYVILDEAHAIKSTSSQRWKTLMTIKCRNRLLLTGTPIQNSMQELWALLHFIMPNLFDSHEEFNEWFSKDIESCADQPSRIDESQLSRLHSILKPFMLRRIKKDVEFQLTDKVEVMVHCDLSKRQRLLYQAMKNQISPQELLTYGFGSSQQVQLMNIVMQFRKVCNHPDLFGKRDVFVTNYWVPDTFILPVLLFDEVTAKHVVNLFNIYHPSHTNNNSSFSFAIDLSCREIYDKISSDLYLRHSIYHEWTDKRSLIYYNYTWNRHNLKHDILLTPIVSIYFRTGLLPMMNFLGTLNFCGHMDVCVTSNKYEKCHTLGMETVCYPHWVIAKQERIVCLSRNIYSADRRAVYSYLSQYLTLHNLPNSSLTDDQQKLITKLFVTNIGTNYWNNVRIPSRSSLVIDSGKLIALDRLLCRLKKGDHRVLIFSQMTRMIGILEDYMSFRGFSYVRLDGSLQINKREDMVENFQANDGVFVFLLSTRAGGVGINLTAADTVIFYDSDWNPTVDLQAMDRTHRLGQTRQVTVYRLICKDTIEDRIMQRAREKSEIQKMVISGGKYKAEAQSAAVNEVLKMLLDETSVSSSKIDNAYQYFLNTSNSPVDFNECILTTRRRGRPAGSKNKKTLAKVSEPSEAPPSIPVVKRRGRPVGSKNGTSKLFKDGIDGFSKTALNNAKYGDKLYL